MKAWHQPAKPMASWECPDAPHSLQIASAFSAFFAAKQRPKHPKTTAKNKGTTAKSDTEAKTLKNVSVFMCFYIDGSSNSSNQKFNGNALSLTGSQTRMLLCVGREGPAIDSGKPFQNLKTMVEAMPRFVSLAHPAIGVALSPCVMKEARMRREGRCAGDRKRP